MTAPSGARARRRPVGGSGDGPDDGAGPPDDRVSRWWPPPERRRRRDLVVVGLIAVVALVGTLLVLRGGDEAGTTLTRASPPLSDPTPGPVPAALTEAWRAPNPAGAAPGPGLLGDPTVVGPAVAVARTEPDGTGVVSGLDPVSGAVAWEYRRPRPVCALGEGFGDVVAMFRDSTPVGVYCSAVAALEPSDGSRGPSRTADVRPGTRLLPDESHLVATGRDYLEVWRNDLVATLEYGRLPTPVQSEPQPRSSCPHESIAAGGDSVAVLERCPGEPSDRLSVLAASPQEYDRPEDRFSVLSGVTGGRVVATTGERTAVAAPDGTLRLYDAVGTPVETLPLGPAAGPDPVPGAPGTDPPGQGAGVSVAGGVVLWWSGTATVGLDAATLVPRWTLPGTLGRGATVPTGQIGVPTTILVPVPGGLAVLDADSGVQRAVIPVDRGADAAGPVGVSVVGTTVVEQRGASVVGLRPPG